MKKICLLFIVFISLLISKANAQAGYIVTKNNDTIRGEVKTSFFSRMKFRFFSAADFKNINTDSIKEYQLTKDSSVFIAKKMPTSTMNFSSKLQFVQRLEHGKINLYELVSSTSEHLRTWYAEKTADSLIALKTDDIFLVGNGSKKERQQVFENMLSDDALVSSALKTKDDFSFGTIRLSIYRYNLDAVAQGK